MSDEYEDLDSETLIQIIMALEEERDKYKNLYYQTESELAKLVESLDKKSIATDVS